MAACIYNLLDCYQARGNKYSLHKGKLWFLAVYHIGGSVGCHAGSRGFDSGRTNTQGGKIIKEKVLPL